MAKKLQALYMVVKKHLQEFKAYRGDKNEINLQRQKPLRYHQEAS